MISDSDFWISKMLQKILKGFAYLLRLAESYAKSDKPS